MGAWAVIMGVFVALSLAFPSFAPSASMEQMPVLSVVAVASFLIGGGVLALLGLNWSGSKVSHGWDLERFGWMLACGGFLIFSLSVFWHYPGSLFSWGMPLTFGIGCLIRIRSLALIEKTLRQKLAETKEGL